MGNAGTGNLLLLLLPLLLLGFLFLTQRRRAREIGQFQESLAVGQEVFTTSGMIGTIAALDESVATLQVAPGVEVRFDRRAIGGPAPDASTSTGSDHPTETA
jgi:preprotein translocase subunit YajC